jgi:putative MATE family efflux protein
MTTVQTKENILGTEKISRLLLKFALPGIISMVVNSLYNIVDQIFIGQGVGYLGNGATNVIFPLTTLALAFAFMLGDGTASYMSLMLGRKRDHDAASGTVAGVCSIIVVGVILGIVYYIFITPLCRLFGATDAILPYAIDYGRITAIGLPFCCIAAGFSGLIRADGSPKYNMVGLLTGCIINVILDPIFIFIFEWGVAGAAFATILGQFANAIINLCYLKRMKSVHIDRSSFHKPLKALPQVAKLGISSFISQMVFVVMVAVQNNALTAYGAQSAYGADIPITALGVTMKVFNILMAIIIGLAAGAQPIWGYNYGSGRYDRVKKTFRYVLILGTATICVAFLIFQLAPMAVVSIFGNDNELYNQFAVKCLKIFLLLIPIAGLQMMSGIFFQAVGRPLQASILSLSKQIIFQIPATLILPIYFGVEGILYSGPVADFLAFILALVLLRLSWGRIFAEKPEPAAEAASRPPLEDISVLPAEDKKITPSDNIVITIGRSYGSGGRSVGKKLAAELGLPYYDSEILAAAAADSGIDRKYLESVDEKYYVQLAGLSAGAESQELSVLLRQAELSQREIIEKMAAKSSCVIVGRSADKILKDKCKLLRVFISMPLADRIEYVCHRDGLSPEASQKLIQKVDRERAAYYNSGEDGGRWGDATNYDLVIDAHTFGTYGSVMVIKAALERLGV